MVTPLPAKEPVRHEKQAQSVRFARCVHCGGSIGTMVAVGYGKYRHKDFKDCDKEHRRRMNIAIERRLKQGQ